MTFSSVVPLMIGQAGRYFEIRRAVLPDFVTVMIAFALRSCAVVHVAWEMAVVTSERSCIGMVSKRFW